MKKRQLLAVLLCGAMGASLLAGCGSSSDSSDSTSSVAASEEAAETAGDDAEEAVEEGALTYAGVTLGEDTDLTAEISFFNNRTDLDSDDYNGKTWAEYIADFNEMYPNITVDVLTSTNYADDALTHLQSGDYETVLMIPAIDSADLGDYFLSYGTVAEMDTLINYASQWKYDGLCYGVPSTATAQGVVYNKKVFEEAGITELPTTPDEFIEALQKIKDNTDAIPLYTNYAAGWTMGGQWDSYIGGTATGDATYLNQQFVHTQDPFQDYGDGTHAYAVYKILYDAVANGLTEDDYTTTDWEGSKSMMNNGEIGVMVLGSWAYPQMQAAGDNGEDVGYMPFPISVDGQQYASAGPDYCYGINVNASEDEQKAAMIFVKWMTEESGFYYNEDGLPISKNTTETQLSFEGVTFIQDESSLDGEEDLMNALNSESELNINNGGDSRVQEIVECAATGSKTYDELVAKWNEAWSDAQEVEGVEILY